MKLVRRSASAVDWAVVSGDGTIASAPRCARRLGRAPSRRRSGISPDRAPESSAGCRFPFTRPLVHYNRAVADRLSPPPELLALFKRPGASWAAEQGAAVIAWLQEPEQFRFLVSRIRRRAPRVITREDAEDLLMAFVEDGTAPRSVSRLRPRAITASHACGF